MKLRLDQLDPAGQLALKDRALSVAAEGVTIADMRLPDAPLVYVNSGFERLTGYPRSEVEGRNCRLLQGPETNPDVVRQIRHAIRDERECVVEILNYRKDGSSFWNRLSITPVRDTSERLTHYIGVQSDVTARREAEDALRETKQTLEIVNQRMRADLDAAARIQRSLLPERIPDVPGLKFAWMLRPCTELAGDTLDVVPMNDAQTALYVADVSGHGVPAALLSVTLSHSLSDTSRPATRGAAVATREDSIAALIQELNGQFQMEDDRVQYFTMFYAIFDRSSRLLRYVSAGHPPAILVPVGGAPRRLLAQGFPVGVLPDVEFEERRATLDPGDRLYVYSDGLVDVSRDGEDSYGEERLTQLLRNTRALPLQQSVDRVRSEVERWCGNSEPEDDISLLALEFEGPG